MGLGLGVAAGLPAEAAQCVERGWRAARWTKP